MAAICAYISAVWAGTENPIWPHLALIPGSVLAGISVGVGIVFERPKYSEVVHRVAFWLIVVGIAVESLCTVLLFVVDERISSAQEEKIIAVGKALLPRHLVDLSSENWPDDLIKKYPGLLFGLRKYPPEFRNPNRLVYIQSVPDLEAQTLTDELVTVMRRGGWEVQLVKEDQTNIPPRFIADGITVFALPSGSDDLRNSDLINEAEEISAAVTKAGLTDKSGNPIRRHLHSEDSGIQGSPRYPVYPREGIFIEIGANPVTGIFDKIVNGKATR